ncbi:MAG: hypothetical protein ABIR35_05045, partial [Polaromonas sp.]
KVETVHARLDAAPTRSDDQSVHSRSVMAQYGRPNGGSTCFHDAGEWLDERLIKAGSGCLFVVILPCSRLHCGKRSINRVP